MANSGYPLLSNIFYGDYDAAVDLMRPYNAAQIFSAQTPLVIGTTAETWAPELTGAITQSATSALALKPDRAPAYFLRGWASYLADPVANRDQAQVDVARAVGARTIRRALSGRGRFSGGWVELRTILS